MTGRLNLVKTNDKRICSVGAPLVPVSKALQAPVTTDTSRADPNGVVSGHADISGTGQPPERPDCLSWIKLTSSTTGKFDKLR